MLPNVIEAMNKGTPMLASGSVIIGSVKSTSNDQNKVNLPAFLPNPSKILVGAFDAWCAGSGNNATDKERLVILQALRETIKEQSCNGEDRLESIPCLIRNEDPQASGVVQLDAAPTTEKLLV